MKQRSLFVFCLILGLTGLAVAQRKTVTNADLEKYRQTRLKGEREYRENYARLGLPSPAELDRRIEKSRIESEQLSAKLRLQRLERERIEAEAAENTRLAAPYYRYSHIESGQYYSESPYFFSYGQRRRYPFRRAYSQPGYFAGGQFWPTGSRTRPQRLISIRRR